MDEVPIQFFTNAKVKRYLEEVVKSGLYGNTISDAAERIVSRWVEDLLSNGLLDETERSAM